MLIAIITNVCKPFPTPLNSVGINSMEMSVVRVQIPPLDAMALIFKGSIILNLRGAFVMWAAHKYCSITETGYVIP